MSSPPFVLLACAVLECEIQLHARGAAHIMETRWFEIGLHDRPQRLRATLQEQLDSLEARADIEAVVLAYGLCGRGTAGLRPRRHRLVLPRAHDCITLFLGSKEAHADFQSRCPACFYYTPGWNRARRVPGPDRLESLAMELRRRFQPDEVEYLLQLEREQWAARSTAAYLELGTEDADAEAAYAKKCADWLCWSFERHRGDPTLLRDLLWGRWDAGRFLVVEPGMQVGHAPDQSLLRKEPVLPELPANY